MTLYIKWLLVPDGLVWVFQKLLVYWDYHTQPSVGFTEWSEREKISSEFRGETEEMGGEEEGLQEKTTLTLRVPLLSAENRKVSYDSLGSPKLDNSRVEKQCLVWRIWVRIWRKNHKSMDPSFPVSPVQTAAGVMGWGDVFLAVFGLLRTNWGCFTTSAYLRLAAGHVHPSMTTVSHLLMILPAGWCTMWQSSYHL